MVTRRRNRQSDGERSIIIAVIVALLGLAAAPTIILTYFVVEQQKTLTNHEGRIAALETKLEDCCSRRVQERDLGGFVWKTYGSNERDEAGNVVLTVEIDILSEEYRWACGSDTTIVRENDESGRTYDLGEIIRQYSANRELKDAKAIVVVGTASAEGDEAAQEVLAADRIETLFNLVQSNLAKTIPIYGMNFGKYEGETTKKCSPDTAAQRRVLIVKVTKQKEGMSEKELGDSLKRRFEALASDSSLKFPIDIRKYSKYQKGEDMLTFGRRNEGR